MTSARLGLYARFERLQTVNGKLRGDTTDTAGQEPGRRGELGGVFDAIPVSREDLFGLFV